MREKTSIPPGPAPAADPILRPPAASAYMGLSESTLAKRRLRGDPPTFVKLGPRLVGYRRSVLDAWLDEGARDSTSDPGTRR